MSKKDKELILELSHDVSKELRDEKGRWSGGSAGSGSKKRKGIKGIKSSKKKPLSQKEWKEYTTKEKAIAVGANAAFLGVLATPVILNRPSKPRAQDSINKVNNHFKALAEKERKRKFHETVVKPALAAQKAARNKAIKQGVRREVRKGIRKSLSIAQLVRYHSQKLINKFSKPKVAGLLTHIK